MEALSVKFTKRKLPQKLIYDIKTTERSKNKDNIRQKAKN